LMVEGGQISSCVAHEDIELAEFHLDLAEHGDDLFRTPHIGLYHQTIGAAFADLAKRVVCSSLVLEIMDSYLDAARRQFQGDSSTNSTGASGDQRVFSV